MDIDFEHLPPSALELAELAGPDGFRRLLVAFGGTRLAMPVRWDRQSAVLERLRGALGLELAHRLWERYRGERFDVPRCAAAVRAERNRVLRQRWAAGETQTALAIEFGLTDRQVRTICGTS